MHIFPYRNLILSGSHDILKEKRNLCMRNIDSLVDNIWHVVKNHYLGEGAYCRFLFQNDAKDREMGINEYGCADAMNILYTIGKFPVGKERELCKHALLSLQHKDSGLFIEKTHDPIHTTAHCLAALELFDSKPLYPLYDLQKYFTPEGVIGLLDSLGWRTNPWPQSHKGAGIFVAGALTESVDLQWQRAYFKYLYDNVDPKWGMSMRGSIDEGAKPAHEHLNGWFHYTFNTEYARKPIRYPDKLIDTCIYLYDNKMLHPKFGRKINFAEIDWVYVLNRCTRQTPHRFFEAKERLRAFAKEYIDYLEGLDFETDDGINDLHMLFGAVCALAELQSALPGEIETEKPLRLVLDRRPFI